MPSEIPSRWIGLRLQRDANDPTVIWISYADDARTRRTLPRTGG